MKKESIGGRIKTVRKSRKCTQEEFGAQIGVKGNTITGYERGTRSPSDAVINNLCRTFGVNQTWLRTGEGEMDIAPSETGGVLERLYAEYNCNPLEQKFLDGYFSLPEMDRDAFCGLMKKMFPDAVRAIAGDDALVRLWQEATPLETSESVDVLDALQKQPAELTEGEIDAVSAEIHREMLEEKEAAEKSSLSSGSSGSTEKMA